MSNLLTPAVVLARYANAIVRTPSPQAIIFDYTIEQAGLHDIEQNHRIYRGNGMERDETLGIDGRTLSLPVVRVFAGMADHYDILAVAPRSERYVFTFVKAQRRDGHFEYVFRTIPRIPMVLAVTSVTIDGQAFLPSVMTFAAMTGVLHAGGQLTYANVNGYRLIHDAFASAVIGGKQVRERIAWMGYQFPPSLPPATFAQPQ
jgi:hypothetical protein